MGWALVVVAGFLILSAVNRAVYLYRNRPRMDDHWDGHQPSHVRIEGEEWW